MRHFSLKYRLTLPFVLLILLVSAGTVWMMHDAGKTTVRQLIHRVLNDLLIQVKGTTEERLTYAIHTLETFVIVGKSNGTNPIRAHYEIASLEQRAQQTLRQFQDPGTYVCFGGVDGRFVGLYKLNSYLNELYVRQPGAPNRKVYAISGSGAPPALLRTDAFDPRTRPWYLSAIDQSTAVWSDVYFDFTSKRPVITLARSIRDERHQKLGVAAVDIELHTISERLRNLSVGQNGVAFVMDTQGKVIASSEPELPLATHEGKAKGLSVPELNHPLIRAAHTRISQWRDRPPPEGQTVSAEIDSPHGTLHLMATTVGRQQGIDWITVVIAPDNDFLQDLTRSLNRSLAATLGSVALSLLIGMWLLNRVLRDIRQLNDAAIRIGRGEIPPPLNIDRNDELGLLARSFHEMGHNLRTDALTGSFNRQYLFKRLRSLRQLGETEVSVSQRFALLFVDLDDFKTINDHHGHDVGDAVLVEIAARLNAAVRSTDTVVRYGGDEFVVLLNDMESDASVRTAADKIRTLVERPVHLGDIELHTGISIGWAFCPEDGGDTEALLKTADQRMFQAKKERKQRSPVT